MRADEDEDEGTFFSDCSLNKLFLLFGSLSALVLLEMELLDPDTDGDAGITDGVVAVATVVLVTAELELLALALLE